MFPIDNSPFPSDSPDFIVVYLLFDSIASVISSTSFFIYSVYVCVSASYSVICFSPFFTDFILLSFDTSVISNSFVCVCVSGSCGFIFMFSFITLFPSLNVTVEFAMFSNHSVPSPICTFAFSLLEITSISASCSSLPLSDTCTAYFPSCSFTTFPFTLIDAIVLSVEYFMMFTWYVVLSPLSDFTIMSTVVFSFAVDIVFDNTCVAVSPAISTVALSLVVTTSTDDSSLFLSIYFVYVFVLESYSSGFVLFIVIWHVVSVDFLSISSIYDLLVSPSCAVIVIFNFVFLSPLNCISFCMLPVSSPIVSIFTFA